MYQDDDQFLIFVCLGPRFGLEILMFSSVWLDLSGESTLSSDLFIFPGLGAQGQSQVAEVFKKLSDHGLVMSGSVVRFVISVS